MKHLLTIFTIVLVSLPQQGVGETPPSAEIQDRTRTSMVSFSILDAYILAVGTVFTAVAFQHENQPQMVDNLDGIVSGPADFGNGYGSVWGATGVTLFLGGVGILGDEPRFTSSALDMATSLIVTNLVVGSLKYVVDRERPNGAPYSFPSGHTATSFCMGAVLNRHFGWKVGILAYTAAVFTGLGRIEDNKHYLSDVAAGATIGILTGRSLSFPFYTGRISTYQDGTRVGLAVNF